MSYVTLAQLEDRFGTRTLVKLTDRGDIPTDVIDPDVIARALADTDAVIDGHVAARYALPMAAMPELLTDVAAALAIYKLHVYEPDPKIVRDRDGALATLRAIARGDIRLEVEGRSAPGTGGSGARVTDRERPMTAENLKGFI